MSTEQVLFQKQFFSFYYDPSHHSDALFPPLREKYKAYKQQAYFTPRPISEVNYAKKFQNVCSYLCFVGALKAEKMEIVLIQQLIEEVFDDFQRFFEEGGWKAVKNKSNRCKLQEYLLLKLGKLYNKHKSYGSLDNFVLSFFYTLNYFKTCNYEIKLFSEFLMAQSDLDFLFLFIILRKRSRRHQRDLVIKSQHIASVVAVLKSQQQSPAHGISMFASENDQLGEVKLLLIFPQLVQYIRTNEIILHQVMIYNLMRCAGLTDEQSPLQTNKLNWTQFINSYFSQICSIDKNYTHTLIQETVKANLKLADRMFSHQDVEMSRRTFNDSYEEINSKAREKFLEESFSWLIGALEALIYKKSVNQRWIRLYDQGTAIFDYDLFVGRILIQQLMVSPPFYEIYNRHLHNRSQSQHQSQSQSQQLS